ncbi:YicC family protein [Pusillimonas sp. TS35]|uniref:YicC/YloC family endoribonuclease n=1 Tax=Paracandidimonas lactea TaxID=2895524 RepID=UPI0013696A17|nr:YicC/YloC family endoribonuclease [Paracandidimonas lactea]MYN12078.1 YicC family protein [Pusillimonas sp. TS35]
MIRSMTAFGSARAESTHGSVNIEFRSVNSRFLDINFRIPEELRMAEGMVREQLGQQVKRGKVDIRVSFARAASAIEVQLDEARLADQARKLELARRYIADVPAPTLSELAAASRGTEVDSMDGEAWMAMCQQATAQALADLQATREREGARLAQMMLECAATAGVIVDEVERDLPTLLAEHQEKIATRLRDALLAASPEGFAQISGNELSARIAQEASLFALRIDVAEELSRLRSHIAELRHLLAADVADGESGRGRRGGGSAGKRLDFLFQEMNREANTLGSKAGALSVTRAAIDLKLQIEQMREQAQNIE